MLEGMFAGGAVPAMERGLAFASARHRLILENIANADTPGYRRRDLDAGAFRCELEATGGKGRAEFRMARSGEAQGVSAAGMLRHDGNDVNVEMELASLSKNASYHGQLAALLRKSYDQIRMAIGEKVTG